MEVRRDVFQAIADPTRRAIIGLVAHERLNLNAVADHFDVSRPAISRHMKILEECGLVIIKKNGRERWCVANVDELNAVSDWVDAIRGVWDAKFDRLDQYLAKIQTEKKDEGK